MVDRDPAFLWETEALRASPAAPTPSVPPPTSRGWVTLRQASESTGIPVSTLRKWARRGRVPSRLEETEAGARRLVALEEVQARARGVRQDPTPEPERSARSRVEPPPPVRENTGEPTPPHGTMLVPIDAWDKMLLQLGNLHQAGQQLAEARERAARAETEAAFLRERLAELKAGREESVGRPGRAEESPVEAELEDAPPPAQPARMPSLTAYLWRMAVSDRRRKK